MIENPHLVQITQSIIDCDPGRAVETVQEALSAGLDAQVILNEGLMPGSDEVGQLFERGEYFLSELMLAGRALKAAMEILRPHLLANRKETDEVPMGKIVIATIQTDIHDIGKSLVASMLTAAGFELVDLGVDVPIKTILDKAEEAGADIIALSALLTTSMPYMRDVLELLKARGLRQKYLVVVGGAPVTQAWAVQIGADGTASNAADAVRLCRGLLAARSAARPAQEIS